MRNKKETNVFDLRIKAYQGTDSVLMFYVFVLLVTIWAAFASWLIDLELPFNEITDTAIKFILTFLVTFSLIVVFRETKENIKNKRKEFESAATHHLYNGGFHDQKLVILAFSKQMLDYHQEYVQKIVRATYQLYDKKNTHCVVVAPKLGMFMDYHAYKECNIEAVFEINDYTSSKSLLGNGKKHVPSEQPVKIDPERIEVVYVEEDELEKELRQSIYGPIKKPRGKKS